jgi:hypothetical protein
MSAQPQWITATGSLGTVPEGVFYSTPLLAIDPIVQLPITSVIKDNNAVILNFLPQPTVPFETGKDVVLTGFDPVEYNGNYTVLQATQSSIRIFNPLSVPVRNLNITGYSNTSTSVTFTFGNYGSVPFAVGSKIFLTGFTPASYNQQYLVSDCTSTSVTVEQSDPQEVSKFGIISNLKTGTATSTPTTIYYALIAGRLPDGMQIQQTGILAGVPLATSTIQGVPTEVGQDVTSKFVVRAYTQKTISNVTVINRLADRTFELTVTGQDAPEFVSPPGQLAQYYDGSIVTGLQVLYTDTDPDQQVIIRLIAGQLPPGLVISPTGLISGFIPVTPNPEGTGGWSANGEAWDEYPYSFSTRADSVNYEFVLEASDGVSSTLRTFTIFVWARSTMTADNTEITADNTFITADVSPVQPPLILNAPGSIGTVRNDNFFAYQFNGVDLDNEPFTIFPIVTVGTVPNVNVAPPGNPQTLLNLLFPAAVAGSGVIDLTLDQLWVYDGSVWDNFGIVSADYTSALPPGLTLDPVSGWLYGYIPNTGISTNLYAFSLLIKKTNDPDIFSGPYNYSLTITGPISSEVVWLTPSDPIQLARIPSSLGSIVNGSTSTLYVKAQSLGNLELQYELYLGTESQPQYNLLPQGLELLSTGEIAGRCSFNTFALDGGTTTFDVTKQNGADPTTFDLVRVFTVRAFSADGVVSVLKTFSITVIRQFNEPYENLYIQCMPPSDDRVLLDDLLQNSDIFPPELLYRPDDPNFGSARRVIYNHAYGLTAATIQEYYNSLNENHYWKNLVLGEIKTAQARDSSGNVIYEVVYSQIVDNLVNNAGQSVRKVVELPYSIDYGDNLVDVTSVTPNSLVNMRDQVIDTVGQVSNILPAWMTSTQQDGSVLGFVPAWVIAYTKPEQANRIAYFIQTQFNHPLNLIDFEVDRYELDRLLTKYWDPATQNWVPSPPEATTFDVLGEAVDWQNDLLQTVEWVNNDNLITTWVSGGAAGQPTVFDQNSLQFTAPVDMYSNTQEYDKYLVFQKRNILE